MAGEGRRHTVGNFCFICLVLFCLFVMLDINYIVFLLLVILVHSLIAAFPVTSGPSCHAGIRGEGLAVAKREREQEEDVGEEGRPTEDDGK